MAPPFPYHRSHESGRDRLDHGGTSTESSASSARLTSVPGVFALMHGIFVYLPLVFLATTLRARPWLSPRSMFSRPIYVGLRIGWATSLLAFLTAGCIVGIIVLLFFLGDKLRAWSKFSAKVVKLPVSEPCCYETTGAKSIIVTERENAYKMSGRAWYRMAHGAYPAQ